jgi:glycosyltransferase involved in cell wall biosynthesis
MKIAHITCVFLPEKNGMANASWNFARLNMEEGHQVAVFTPNYRRLSLFPRTETLNGIKIERIYALAESGNGAFVPGLYGLLKGYDAVYLHYPFFGGAETVLAAHILGAFSRLYVHYHMAVSEMRPILKFLSLPSRFIEPLLFARATGISCASLSYLRSSPANKYFEKFPEKFFEIPFGVDTERFYPPLEALKKNGGERKNDQSIKIIFVGALDKAHNFKGLPELFNAAKILAEKKIRKKILVVGEGDLVPSYRSLASKLMLDEIVVWRGLLSDGELPAAFQSGDIFVLPSTAGNEAFGMVILEALSCGIPVIASRLPGVSSVFTDGQEGLYVEPGSAEDLAQKIEILALDPGLRKKFGSAGRRLALEKYSWKKTGEKIEKMINT